MQTFDIIVIGGGPGGCAVAARLSKIPDCQVALSEAGPDRRGLLADNLALGALALGPRRHLRPGGHLVLVASLAGLVGNFGYAAYGASKFGVVGLARALDLDLLPLGIDVSVCCPGVIHTPMVAHEQQVEHRTTRLLAEMPGVMEVGPACEGMLHGIARRRFMVKVGFKGRATAWMAQHFPEPMRLSSRAIVRSDLG